MGGNRFQFKRFAIEQEGCAMKVGTDGVLLGAWCRILPTDKAILDIGTGTGVIALQLAQRTESTAIDSAGGGTGCNTGGEKGGWTGCNASDEAGSEMGRRAGSEARSKTSRKTESKKGSKKAFIEAIEIDPVACGVARRNFEASAWADRMELHCMSVQEFAGLPGRDESSVQEFAAKIPFARFDHIVSNPPYFSNSLVPPDRARKLARHTDALSYEGLIGACDRLLVPTGRISLVLPAGAETDNMIATAEKRDFILSRRMDVHSTPNGGVKRCLLEFSRASSEASVELSQVVIEDAGPGTFSPEYRALTRDFYLYF